MKQTMLIAMATGCLTEVKCYLKLIRLMLKIIARMMLTVMA